ncbi:MAG: enoyl-CoA hydratase [Chloroflexi bacterium]|nr:enoyl-CoA hydratase [Chloroflexota bacterium]
MSWSTILYEKIDGNIARIVLNRPETHNAQDYLLIEEMDEAMKQAEEDPEVKVIILAGAGPSFSSGHDMSGRGKPSPQRPELSQLPGLEGSLAREQYIYIDKCLVIRNLTKPTIAQVQGHCLAAGWMVAAMCDIIVASEDADFGDPVLRMTPAAVEILFHPWEVGARKAKELLWTGDRITAMEAWRLGAVNKVVPREKLEEETLRIARKIALTPNVTVSLTKRSINRTLDIMGQADAWDYHMLIHQMSHHTEQARAYREERRKAMERGGLREFLKMRDEAYSKA